MIFYAEDMYEQAAVSDERLLEQYLETGKIRAQDLADAIRTRTIFPCFWGSALKLTGVEELLEAMERYMEPPSFGNEFGARVFKISRDEKGERLTYLKITGGTLKCRAQLNNHEGKVTQIRLYSGAKYETTEEASAGMVCAVTGFADTFAGEGLGYETGSIMPVLEPVLSYKLIYPPEKDAVVVRRDMRQLEEEEPELHVDFEETTGELFVKVMGQVQLQVLAQIVKRQVWL